MSFYYFSRYFLQVIRVVVVKKSSVCFNFNLFNKKLLHNMPPKRKAATSPERPDSTTDFEIVKASDKVKTNKRVKKPKAELNTNVIENVDEISNNVNTNKRGKKVNAEQDTNGIESDEDNVLAPKRARLSRTIKTVVKYDETENAENEKSSKAKKKPEAKKSSKNDKPSAVSGSPQPGPSWRVTPDRLEDESSGKRAPKKKAEPKSKDVVKKEKAPPKSKAKTDKTKKKGESAQPKIVENGEKENEEKEPKVKEPLNKTDTEWHNIDFSCEAKNGFGIKHNLIVSTWNVGGLKSWVKKGCMEYLKQERPDILCMQETKCSKEKLPNELSLLKDYHQYWCSSDKEGYAGVGLLSVKEPKRVMYGIDNEDQDVEGRCITAEYDEFYLVNVYVPNAGRKLVTMPKRLDWNKAFKEYVIGLEVKKPVVICGDMNVSHNTIDLARPQNNTKNAGFTKEEREGLTELLNEGFVDAYRHLYPDKKDVYSFWTYMANSRAKNVGWRLDYFIISKEILKGVCDIFYRTQVLGSDHCPVTLFINI